jgi:hypothetical protein
MSLWERLTGKAVEAAALGQKKRAAGTGILAFDGPLSDLRLEIAIKSHPWLQGTAATTLLLSTWASRALQDMAAVMEADAVKHLGESGRLPEATFVLADGLYDSALKWIDLAQSAQAAIASGTEFVPRFRLPSPPPRFDWVADAPPAHFVAAIAGAVQLGTSAEDVLNAMQEDRSRLPKRYDGAFETIAAAIRLARAKLDQVEAAASDRQAVRLSRDIWAMLAEVVHLYFLAGQQATMPGLIDSKYDAAAGAAARARRLPPPPQPASQGPLAGQPGAPAPVRPGARAPVQHVQPPGPGEQDWSSVDWTGRRDETTGSHGPAPSPVRVGQGSAVEPSAFTCYDLLGVLPGSSPEQISCEYRSKASVLGPALWPGAPSTVITAASRAQRMLDGALHVLGDPESRLTYDQAIGIRRVGGGLEPSTNVASQPGWTDPGFVADSPGADALGVLMALTDCLAPHPHPSRRMAVPDVRGLFYSVALHIAGRLGLHLVPVRLTQNPMPVDGLIVDQSPQSPAKVHRDSELTVQVWHPPAH